MDFITFLWLMLFAHFVGDYVLKTEWLSVTKGEGWYNMVVHCFLYTGSIGCVLLKYVVGFPYVGILGVFVFHWIIDMWKCDMMKVTVDDHDAKVILGYDQIGHLFILGLIIYWYS